MKRVMWFGGLLALAACAGLSVAVRAEDTVAQSVSVLDEKVNRLGAQIEDLQFRQQKMQQQLDDLQTQVKQLRQAGAGVAASDLQALENRIRVVDAAREKDKQVILDELAKQLAAIGGAKGPGKSPTTPPGEGREHVVQKGDTLTTIAKAYGVSVEDLKKANNLSNPNDLKIGQKLTIPK